MTTPGLKSSPWLHSCKPDPNNLFDIKSDLCSSLCTRFGWVWIGRLSSNNKIYNKTLEPTLTVQLLSQHRAYGDERDTGIDGQQCQKKQLAVQQPPGNPPSVLIHTTRVPERQIHSCAESAPLKVERSYHALALSNPALSNPRYSHVRTCATRWAGSWIRRCFEKWRRADGFLTFEVSKVARTRYRHWTDKIICVWLFCMLSVRLAWPHPVPRSVVLRNGVWPATRD